MEIKYFEQDEVWETPKGFRYKVVGFCGLGTVLRLGSDGKGIKKIKGMIPPYNWTLIN